ncbi:mechanosensitive ion channel domain-containing protein [Ketobacter sp.]|uniref:mechanosensitive ion channel domain-containing protein n=1 Tax=Ketobacter sp. TaxID=2083498 RepID=UPI0025B7E720|nr:mechanosensitive ion channel domain-containing protein [Ketobacter sp.]
MRPGKGFGLSVVLGLVLWLWALPGLGQLGVGVSAPAEETSQVEAVSKELDLLRKELAEQQTITSSLEQSIQSVKNDIQSAPGLADQLRKEIKQLEQRSSQGPVPKSDNGLENAIALLDAQAKALQESLSYVLAQIGEQQALPSQAREEVKAAQKQAQELEQKLRDQQSSLKNESVKALQAGVLKQQLTNANLRKALAQNRLEGYQKLLDLYTVNRDLLFMRMEMLKSALEMLRKERDERRLQTAGEHQDTSVILQGGYEQLPPVLAEELKENQRLKDLLVSRTADLNRVTDELVAGKQELQDIRYRFEVAKQQLELTSYHQYVDDYLLRQRQLLQAKIREQESSTTLHQDISRARLEQFKLDEKLHGVRTDTARRQTIEKRLQESGLQVEQVKEDLNRIYESRATLLTKLVEINADYVVNLTNLELLQGDQLQERRQFYELLNKKLFWRRSATPLDWNWVSLLPGSIRWFAMEQPWTEPFRIWYQWLIQPIYPLLALLVVAAIYVGGRRKVIQRLEYGTQKIGNVTKDRFRYTLESLLGTILLALPIPFALVVLAYPLLASNDTSLFGLGVGSALLVLARWLSLIEFVRHLVEPNGLAVQHFRWRASAIAAVQRWLPLLYLQLPCAFIFIVVWREGDDFHSGILGRAAFLLVALLFVLFCARMFSPRLGITQQEGGKSQHWYQRWNRGLFWVCVLIPASLVALSVQGYSFSAMEIMVLMYQTITYGFFIFILEQVLMRWFAVLERKLAYARAIEKRDAQRKAKEQQEAAGESGEAVPELELPSLDVATISEQNRALLRVVAFSLFAVVCYLSWQDFFQAIQIFQEIELWTYTVASDTGVESKTVTLETLLAVSLAVMISYVGVKNLPGLIEVLILQRLKVDSGIRFAITTTARYLVITAGVMIISGMIGLDWSKLGWLVAALGVGLGFGLQEIFANFISGLIILFERPIRIGDTVTINELSGTVSQIRMRATTITDWDQKELIIPNKTFVTNQFINWTLSDSTTRVVIKVGVAYGSDTDLVAKTLLEIAQANPIVLKEPAPSAFFLGFGASSLDFELRGFVANFSKRLVLIHELHTAIDKRFRTLGIEIAFPQLDLHVKHLPKPD